MHYAMRPTPHNALFGIVIVVDATILSNKRRFCIVSY